MSKRGAEVQLSKEGPFNGDGSGSSDYGTATKASSAQLAKRKILSARRPGGGSSRSTIKPTVSTQPQTSIFGSSSNQNSNSMNGNPFGQSGPGSSIPNGTSNIFAFGQSSSAQKSSLEFGGPSVNSTGFSTSSFAFPSQATGSSNDTFKFGNDPSASNASVGAPSSTFNFNSNSAFSFNSDSTGPQNGSVYNGSLFNIPNSATTTTQPQLSAPANVDSKSTPTDVNHSTQIGSTNTPQWPTSSPFQNVSSDDTAATKNQSSLFSPSAFAQAMPTTHQSNPSAISTVSTNSPFATGSQNNIFSFSNAPSSKSGRGDARSVFSTGTSSIETARKEPSQFPSSIQKFGDFSKNISPVAHQEPADKTQPSMDPNKNVLPSNASGENTFVPTPTKAFPAPSTLTPRNIFTPRASSVSITEGPGFQSSPNNVFAAVPQQQFNTVFSGPKDDASSTDHLAHDGKSSASSPSLFEVAGGNAPTAETLSPHTFVADQQLQSKPSTDKTFSTAIGTLEAKKPVAQISKPLINTLASNVPPALQSQAIFGSQIAERNGWESQERSSVFNKVSAKDSTFVNSSQNSSSTLKDSGSVSSSFTLNAPSRTPLDSSVPLTTSSYSNGAISEQERIAMTAECLSVIPEIPDCLVGPQRDEYLLAYRMLCLDKGLRSYIAGVAGTSAELAQASLYYDLARSIIYQAAGLKLKTTAAETPDVQSAATIPGTTGNQSIGLTASASVFNVSATGKRRLSNDSGNEPKKARGEVMSSSLSARKSQTSKIFADLANSPMTGYNRSKIPQGNLTPKAISLEDSSSTNLNNRDGSTTSPFGQKDASISSDQVSDTRGSSNVHSQSTFAAPNFLAQFGEKAKAYDHERKMRAKEEDWDSDEESYEDWERRYDQSIKGKRQSQTASSMPKFTVSAGTNFLAQFSKNAAKTAEDEALKAKEKRKEETYDSDEDEAEWERRDAEEQHRLKLERENMSKSESLKFKVQGASPAFSGTSNTSVFSSNGLGSRTPTPSIFENLSRAESDAEGSKTGDADNEESEGSGDELPEGPTTPTGLPPGGSLFDRITRDKNGDPVKEPPQGAEGDGNQSRSFSASSFQNSTQNPIARTNQDVESATPLGDHTWKPESLIKFASSTSSPSINITSPSPSKGSSAELKSGGLFTNLFGSQHSTSTSGISVNPPSQLNGSNSQLPISAGFNFASSLNASASNSLAPKSILDSATTSRGTSPGMTTADDSANEGVSETASNDPQLDLSNSHAGEENEDVLFSVKAKGLELASPTPGEDKGWITRGVGDFRLLQNRETRKCRMILRAGPASKVVLNCGLQASVKYSIESGKVLQFLAPKADGLTKWALRVKLENDAQELLRLIEINKKN